MNLREKVDAIPYWYHKIELPGGIVTPGWSPLFGQRYRLPEDLTGKRVLDVGAWDGYWTFECLKRGAREVVAIDDFTDLLGLLESRGKWESFDLCREALGYSEDVCKRIEMSVYDVDEETLGRFDVILCYGVIYHMKHPLLVLETLGNVCDETIFIESAVSDYHNPYGEHGDGPVMSFCPGSEYGENASNWWIPNLKALKAMAASLDGFREAEAWHLTDLPRELTECRGFVRVSRQRSTPKVVAVMSVPRLGFMDNIWCAVEGFASQGIPMKRFTGAFWGHQLTEALEDAIAEDCDLVFTLDYDTVFSPDDVTNMIRIMCEHPELDALAGTQTKRETSEPMFNIADADGKLQKTVMAIEFQGEVTKISAAHFGLTVIRIAALKKMSLPWLWSQPGPDGRWDEGRLDADMYFWDKFRKEGFTLGQSNKTRLGHMELMITWAAGPAFKPLQQHIGDYNNNGRPKEVC